MIRERIPRKTRGKERRPSQLRRLEPVRPRLQQTAPGSARHTQSITEHLQFNIAAIWRLNPFRASDSAPQHASRHSRHVRASQAYLRLASCALLCYDEAKQYPRAKSALSVRPNGCRANREHYSGTRYHSGGSICFPVADPRRPIYFCCAHTVPRGSRA